jgi:uncharacterized protein (DUF1697 family)
MATRRYAAFLRGVTPMNLKMAELKTCFEAIGFTDVKTVLASGNVVFSAPAATEASLQRKAEDAMERDLGRRFLTMVRSLDALREIVDRDPYGEFTLAPEAKRIVTFLRDAPASRRQLPVELDGARLLCLNGCDAFGAYVPSPRGPVFMTLILKQFGEDVTTRTWDTVKKVLGSHPAVDAAPRGQAPRAVKAKPRGQMPQAAKAKPRGQVPQAAKAKPRGQMPQAAKAKPRGEMPRAAKAEPRGQAPRAAPRRGGRAGKVLPR